MRDDSTLGRRALPLAGPPEAVLRVVYSADPTAVGRTFGLDEAWVIGRQTSIALADPRLSREHARIHARAGIRPAELEDLRSANGTFLNGQPVHRAPLGAHDVITVGETILVVDQSPLADRLPASDSASDAPIEGLLGESAAARRIRRAVRTIAAAGGPVLILGETGVGKEMAARAIHAGSGRSGPLVAVNCAAIPADIAEAELFGHKRGAFTGALADRTGAFQAASGGTLFLDEIAELAPALQAKLLRAIETSEIQPLGGGPAQPVDVRLIAATLHDPSSGRLRADLHARLAEWELELPPMSARRADVLVLFDHFLGTPARGRTFEASEALVLYGWPQNVREIRNLARRTTALVGPSGVIDLEHLPAAMRAPVESRAPHAPSHTRASVPPPEVDDASVGPGRAALEAALAEAKGNVSQVAEKLGVHRQQLYRWLTRLAIDPSRFR